MKLTRALPLLLLLAVTIIGQTNKGGISGTVIDSRGGVIAGATVTVTNAGTNQAVTLTTSDDGAFSVNSLEPVIYNVKVEAANFKETIVQNVKVDTASTAAVNVTLEPGGVGEIVTIEADAPLINTENGTAGQTITERQLRELPLSNRSVLDLAVTAPNVSGDAGSEDPEVTSGQPTPGFNLNVNGGRSGSTNLLADGVNNTGVGIARAVVSFTPETVQEFTVQTSAYSAEFGSTGGGVINITTKSGTNRFTGTALLYHRNPATNAQPYRIGTTPRTPNNLRYTQGSLSVGGPVFLPSFNEGGPAFYNGRNRTFFFAAYEPRWRQDFVTVTTLLPTAAERAGDFRNLTRTANGWVPNEVAQRFNLVSTGPSAIYQQFTLSNGRLVPITLGTGFQYCQFNDPRRVLNAAGQPQCTAATNANINDSLNVIPSSFIDPTSQKILSFLPQGGDYFVDNGAIANYVVNRQVTQNETRYTVRLDHNVTESNKLNFRVTVTPAIGVRNFGSDVNGSTGVFSDAKQFLLGDEHIFTPNVVNNLRLNYTRGVFSEDFAPEFSINGGRNLATELGLPSLTNGGIPLFNTSADGYNAFASIGSSGSTNNFNVEERFNINDILYWTRGNMTWKFGVDLSQARLNVVPFFAASGGRWNFRVLNTSNNRGTNVGNGGNVFASLVLGVPNSVDVRPLLLNYDYQYRSGAAFVQNDWKVRPNFTLNLGFRYSLQLPRTEKNDLQGVFRPDLAQTVTLTAAQRRATATALGVATTAAIPDYVPATAQIPVFAFAGRGGRSRYLTPVDYINLEPRFGFAYSPKMKIFGFDTESRSTVIRGGYGISHVPITGNNRIPNPDFGGFQGVSTVAGGSTVGGTADPTQPVRLTGNNPFVSSPGLDQTLGINSDGLITTNSIGVPGYAYAGDEANSIPYVQNWNLALSMELFKNTVVEIAYVGSKGTNLFTPLRNINPRNIDLVEQLEAANINTDTPVSDPLGRTNALGATVQYARGSLLAPYFGFATLNQFGDPSGNSRYNAGYIKVQRRISNGLSFTSNYTYGKSVDDSSDASPDTRVLSGNVVSTSGQVYFGAPRSLDKSVSTYDIRHNFSTTFVYDLPFGRGGFLFRDAPGVVQTLLGGWTTSGVFRLQGGTPFVPVITDGNRLGGVQYTIRLDRVEGVPLLNPLYSDDCSIGAACEPYVNPAAFKRPAKGSLGNLSRTLDGVRGPLQQYFDFSLQKNFTPRFLGEGRRLNFRIDLLNAFNHPTFRLLPTGGGNLSSFGGLPSEVGLTQAEVTAWNAANPGRTATLAQVNALLDSQRTNGALPLDFFSVPVTQGFATTNPNAFDITTLEGLKLYRLRQAYNANFGTLNSTGNARYIQFGVRLFF